MKTTNPVGRVIGVPLQEAPGQPVVVENRAGANGNIGGEALAKAPAEFGAKAMEDSKRFSAIIKERKILAD